MKDELVNGIIFGHTSDQNLIKIFVDDNNFSQIIYCELFADIGAITKFKDDDILYSSDVILFAFDGKTKKWNIMFGSLYKKEIADVNFINDVKTFSHNRTGCIKCKNNNSDGLDEEGKHIDKKICEKVLKRRKQKKAKKKK
jgi:hypothetical protein